MVQHHEIKNIESFLIEFYDIFALHSFDISLHNSLAYSQSLPTPINLKEDILVEMASLHKYGIFTTLPFFKYGNPIFAQKKPNEKLRLLVYLKKIKDLISDDNIKINNHPVCTLTVAAQHMLGKKLFCELDCFAGLPMSPNGRPTVYETASLLFR